MDRCNNILVLLVILFVVIIELVNTSQPTNIEFCLKLCEIRYSFEGFILNNYRYQWLNCRDQCFDRFPGFAFEL